MFDILSNHRVEILKSLTLQGAGSAVLPGGTYFDMWATGAAPPPLQYQRAQRALFVIDVTIVVATGTLTLVFQDCDTSDGTYDADFATAATITETGLYLVDLPDFKRYLRCTATVANANVTWAGYMVTFEERFRPVQQTGSALALTYGTGRYGRVASS
jgi:hypothetical protein